MENKTNDKKLNNSGEISGLVYMAKELNNVGVGAGEKFSDPLLDYTQISSARHRWIQSNNNPIFRALIKEFLKSALSKDLKFYKNDGEQTELSEHNDLINQELHKIGGYRWMYDAGNRALTHGWQITQIIDKKDEKTGESILDLSHVFSEHESNNTSQIFIRKGNSNGSAYDYNGELILPKPSKNKIKESEKNDIIAAQFQFRPMLPLYRSYNMFQEKYIITLDEMFLTTFGSFNYGYGESVLEGIWSPSMRLLEKASNDHIKNSIFGQLRAPHEISDEKLSELARDAANSIRYHNIWAYRGSPGENGETSVDIPQLNFDNLVPTNKGAAGGASGMSPVLNSDWALITMDTGYSISKFIGDPMGARGASQMDFGKDIIVDIGRFSLVIRDLIVPFLELLKVRGILPSSIDFQKDIKIKSWWEYELLEVIMAQVLAKENSPDKVKADPDDVDSAKENPEETKKELKDANSELDEAKEEVKDRENKSPLTENLIELMRELIRTNSDNQQYIKEIIAIKDKIGSINMEQTSGSIIPKQKNNNFEVLESYFNNHGARIEVVDEIRQLDSSILTPNYQYYFGSITNAAKQLGMSKQTIYNRIKKEKSHVIRKNYITGAIDPSQSDDEYWVMIANGFSTTNPFKYYVNGRIMVEYQCPDSIKKLVGQEVPMGIYHNKNGSPKLPKEQIVGTYRVIEYDEERKEDVAVIKVNKEMIKSFFEKRNEEDWITPMFENGELPAISTAYYANVHYDNELRKYVQSGFEKAFESVSFVKAPNCTEDYCTSNLIKINQAVKTCISDNILKLSKLYKENGINKNLDDIINEAIIECKQ